MSESLIAQCPFCRTRFRLSQEHLQAAAGNVRCGACLKVFNANLTITSPTPAPEAADEPSARHSAVPSGATKADESRDTLMIHDDMDLDNLDLEALGLDESILDEINPAGRSTESAAGERPDQAEFRLVTEPEDESEPEVPTESGVEDVAQPDLDSSMDAQDEEADPWDRLYESDTDQAPSNSEAQSESGPVPTERRDEEFDLHEDFLAAPIARDFELEAPPTESTASSAADSPRANAAAPEPDSGIFLRGRAADPHTDDEQTDAQEPPEQIDDPRRRREPRLGELVDLPDLADEPILLYEQPRARRSRYRPLWVALSILALLGLPAQAIFYNFNTLTHNEQTRPYLDQFCILAGCELPARVNIDLIRSSNLMVRPHPEYPNALAIDVILYNRAEFAQPFPVLRMTFNNTRGREVLSKRFRPDEYLGGELAGATLMPPQTPVRVALDMLDPGPEAAGYQLDFLSP